MQQIVLLESSNKNISLLSNSSEAKMLDDNPPIDKEWEKTSSTKRKGKNKGRAYKTSNAAFGKVYFSKDSRHTPSQAIKAGKERKEGISQLQKAYKGAGCQAPKHEKRVELACIASNFFSMTVAPQTKL